MSIVLENVSKEYPGDVVAVDDVTLEVEHGAMAFCSLAMLPPLVVFIFAQRQVIAGLTTGGTKG